MVLTLQQQKFKIMLEEAITLLCRSSLPYKCEASVEALIGITVDCDDVFLISIKERFDNKMPELSVDTFVEGDSICSDDFLGRNNETVVTDKEESETVDALKSNPCSSFSKKRKRDADSMHAEKRIPQTIIIEGNDNHPRQRPQKTLIPNNGIVKKNESPSETAVESQNTTRESDRMNLSHLVCDDVTEIKGEQLYENFINNCFSTAEDVTKSRQNTGCSFYPDYNSQINVRIEKFPMPDDESDMKPPNLTSLQIAMANEILNISGSFVNIGSAKAFQHNLRVLSKSELSEVVKNMSLPPSNPYSIGVLCTEGVSRVFYKIPPSVIKQEALDFFNLDLYSYNNLYHSSVRVPHNIRDPEEWKALMAMKNPFSFSTDSFPNRT